MPKEAPAYRYWTLDDSGRIYLVFRGDSPATMAWYAGGGEWVTDPTLYARLRDDAELLDPERVQAALAAEDARRGTTQR